MAPVARLPLGTEAGTARTVWELAVDRERIQPLRVRSCTVTLPSKGDFQPLRSILPSPVLSITHRGLQTKACVGG